MPSDAPYEVVHKTAYRVHERVASRYVVGRVLTRDVTDEDELEWADFA